MSKLYYMAPMQNAPWIAVFGICSYSSVRSDPKLREHSVSIADPFVNNRRHARTIGGRSLHEFVPLYWATHTPMQYVVTVRDRRLLQEELVFFVLDSERILSLPGVWTTDGNAAADETKCFEGKGALPYLDWRILRTSKCYSPEYKRKKCAEVLVPDHVPPEEFKLVRVYSGTAAERFRDKVSEVRSTLNKEGWTLHLSVDPSFYY